MFVTIVYHETKRGEDLISIIAVVRVFTFTLHYYCHAMTTINSNTNYLLSAIN